MQDKEAGKVNLKNELLLACSKKQNKIKFHKQVNKQGIRKQCTSMPVLRSRISSCPGNFRVNPGFSG